MPSSELKAAPSVHLLTEDAFKRNELIQCLQDEDFDVVAFDTLVNLLAAWKETPADLLLLDADLAIGGGREVLQLLRIPPPKTAIIIIEETPSTDLTFNAARPADDSTLLLPCSKEDLVARVRGQLGFVRWTYDLPMVAVEQEETNPPIVQARVLIADPDELSRQILAHHFERAGFSITEASNGNQVLEKLDSREFDLVTLEINLPFKNGFEVLELLRPRVQKCPRLVVVSAADRDENVMRAFSLGAHDFVKKPYNPRVVTSRVTRLLELHR